MLREESVTVEVKVPDQRNSDPHAIETIADAGDLRCGCGRLLAKVVPGGLEIRCTRCKASHVLAWSEVEGAQELLGVAGTPPVPGDASRDP